MPSFKTFFWYGIAILLVIALADFMPKVINMFLFILIVGVVLMNFQDYAGLFNPPSAPSKQEKHN